MSVVVRVEGADALAAYATIPIAFTVASVLHAEPAGEGLGGITLRERVLAEPYVKDYDTLGSPLGWPDRFRVERWTFLAAYDGDDRVGGAVVVAGAPDVELLGGRADVAVLWDLRVHPRVRGRGIGAALFGAAEARARSQGCRRLMVETQSTNVPACRFYAGRGCALGAIHRFAYPDLPHETQLLWFRDV